jgi:hypothetical protein
MRERVIPRCLTRNTNQRQYALRDCWSKRQPPPAVGWRYQLVVVEIFSVTIVFVMEDTEHDIPHLVILLSAGMVCLLPKDNAND